MIFRNEILKKQEIEKKNFNYINSQGTQKFCEIDMHINKNETLNSLQWRFKPTLK